MMHFIPHMISDPSWFHNCSSDHSALAIEYTMPNVLENAGLKYLFVFLSLLFMEFAQYWNTCGRFFFSRWISIASFLASSLPTSISFCWLLSQCRSFLVFFLLAVIPPSPEWANDMMSSNHTWFLTQVISHQFGWNVLLLDFLQKKVLMLVLTVWQIIFFSFLVSHPRYFFLFCNICKYKIAIALNSFLCRKPVSALRIQQASSN